VTDPLLTTTEVAELLRCSKSHVRTLRLRAHDPLPCRDLGGVVRFRADEVEAWIENQQLRPVTPQVAKRRQLAGAGTPDADRFLKT